MDKGLAGGEKGPRGYPRWAVSLVWGCRSARATFHRLLYRTSASRPVIDRDLARWIEILGRRRSDERSPASDLVWLIARHPEFRNLFYLRVGREKSIRVKAFLEIAKIFYRPLESLYLYTENIGPGCFIQHGFSTAVDAKRIGENFWLNQQVSIGYSGIDDYPVIGDNVSVRAGAIVLGDITIGDNSVVGAGSVVLKSVPPNCVVVGVPARVVRRDGVDVREDLA